MSNNFERRRNETGPRGGDKGNDLYRILLRPVDDQHYHTPLKYTILSRREGWVLENLEKVKVRDLRHQETD